MAVLRPGVKVLVVDDEPIIVESIKEYFQHLNIVSFADPAQALKALKAEFFDIVLVDYRMPGLSGLDLLIEARRASAYRFGILLTAYADKDLLRQFINQNLIQKVLEKPLDLEELGRVLEDAIAESEQTRAAQVEVEELRREYQKLMADPGSVLSRVVGSNAGMNQSMQRARQFAATDENVLLTGETGTGKELFTRVIHTCSRRRDGPFVKINCGAIPESLIESELFGSARGAFSGAYKDRKGKIEESDGGTLFLDEVTELKLELQSRLLHVVQDKTVERVGSNRQIRVDFRLIAASNRDLREECRAGRFREDLYFRLATLHLHLPPLRERREDIPLLVDHFLDVFCMELNRRKPSVGTDILDRLAAYSWPGNVRELENTVKRALIMMDPQATSIPESAFEGVLVPFESPVSSVDTALDLICGQLRDKPALLDTIEDKILEAVLRKAGGSVMEAVRQSGIPKDRFYRLVKRQSVSTKEQ
jgi:two-component system, NtrC family, response regulator AtoC